MAARGSAKAGAALAAASLMVKMAGCLSCPRRPEPWGLLSSVRWLFWKEDGCLKL